MKIGGLMKLTLLDYPGVLACAVFLEGCNFRCPFCHNSDMVYSKSPDEITEDEFFEFLRKRQGVLEGVCVTGGEPLVSDEIFGFLERIKGMGYKVKLDTNGSFPERLKRIAEMKLCDYVAMDIKNSPEKYSMTVGNKKITFDSVKDSVDFLKKSELPHEFRTTVVKDFHTKADVAEIAELLGAAEKYFIQPFRDGESVIRQGLCEFETEEIKELLESAREFVPEALARGIDL